MILENVRGLLGQKAAMRAVVHYILEAELFV
jgi:hypothetical protein